MTERREIRFNLWPQLQNEDLDLMGKGSKEKKSFFKLFKSFELALQLLSKRTALKKWMERLALGKCYTFSIYIARERERETGPFPLLPSPTSCVPT